MGPVLIMAQAVLPDTDVLIDFLRGFDQAVSLIHSYASHIVLSSIVVAELYAGAKGDAEEEKLGNFIALFRIVPVTADIAKAAGLYKRDFGKSHGVGLADAVIAASCQAERAALKTLNVKHYPMIRGLTPAYVK